MKWIIARAAAGDAIFLDAMLGRLAEILAEQGDSDPLDVRRSKALGILAQPAEALRLLYKRAVPNHHDDDHAREAEPNEPEAEPGLKSEDVGPVLTRFHHRIRTHATWQIRQPEPGTYRPANPHGRIYLVNNTGTHPSAPDPTHTPDGAPPHPRWSSPAEASDELTWRRFWTGRKTRDGRGVSDRAGWTAASPPPPTAAPR